MGQIDLATFMSQESDTSKERVGDSGIEGIEQETEMPIREQKGAQNAHEKHIVQAHNLSQWRMSYADALRGVSSDKAEDERVPTASVSTGRCKRVSWKLDPAVKEWVGDDLDKRSFFQVNPMR